MPEQRKRLHYVAEITLSTTFLLASEVPAIAAFARSGLHQERNSKTHASGYQKNTTPKLAPWARVVSASGLKTHIRSGDVRGGANRSTTLARQRTRTHPRGNTAKARKRKGDRIISTNRQHFRFCYAIFGARSDLRRGDQGSRLGRLSAGLRLSSKLLPRL